MYLKMVGVLGEPSNDASGWGPFSILNLIKSQTEKLLLYVSTLNDIQAIRLNSFRSQMNFMTLYDLQKAIKEMVEKQMI